MGARPPRACLQAPGTGASPRYGWTCRSSRGRRARPVVAAGGLIVNGRLDTANVLLSRSVSTETAARPRPLRLTQARIGDTLHAGNGIRVAIVNAFTTVNPETEATVRAVDYQVVGAAPDQFRVYSDDERDIARWRRVETPESP